VILRDDDDMLRAFHKTCARNAVRRLVPRGPVRWLATRLPLSPMDATILTGRLARAPQYGHPISTGPSITSSPSLLRDIGGLYMPVFR